jgi:hypothetical protein
MPAISVNVREEKVMSDELLTQLLDTSVGTPCGNALLPTAIAAAIRDQALRAGTYRAAMRQHSRYYCQ